MHAFIIATSAYLPGNPVGNSDIDQYLGPADRLSARTRAKILASNGINTRHYAIDPASGLPTHTNAQLCAEAVRKLMVAQPTPAARLDCLVCGTSSADQIMPGHASMVHGELGYPACEVVSTTGICLSGVSALKYAAMNVALGNASLAAATGSEQASSFLRSDFFTAMQHPGEAGQEEEQKQPAAFSFAADFLRWMLSDGAGAVLLAPKPAIEGISLAVEWIEILSQAQALEACMYAGATKTADGGLQGWREHARRGGLGRDGVMHIKQDARLLNREVLSMLVDASLPGILRRHSLEAKEVDWFLPHYSSQYFRAPLAAHLQSCGFPIPEDRWFTNLSTKGNTGAASFYIMLDELFHSGKLRQGQRIFAFVPESGRFSVGYLLLRVV